MFRKLLLLCFLGAAIGVPYVAMNKTVQATAKGAWDLVAWVNEQSEENEDESSEDSDQTDADVSRDPTPEPAVEPTLEGPRVQQLAEVLRFDVSPSWVTGRWSRVSTTLSELDMEGLRVPLVTGTEVDDLAGSLTYYFDRRQRVQRISFRGYTGNEGKLVALLMEHYGFRQEATLGAGLYLVKWNGRPTSALRIQLAPVVRTDVPHSQLEVILEINRPSQHYGLSESMRQMLDQDSNSQRWGKPASKPIFEGVLPKIISSLPKPMEREDAKPAKKP